MNQPLAVAILGASGRMGRALIDSTLRTPTLRLGAAIERGGHPSLGSDAGTLIGVAPAGVALTDQLPKNRCHTGSNQ